VPQEEGALGQQPAGWKAAVVLLVPAAALAVVPVDVAVGFVYVAVVFVSAVLLVDLSPPSCGPIPRPLPPHRTTSSSVSPRR